MEWRGRDCVVDESCEKWFVRGVRMVDDVWIYEFLHLWIYGIMMREDD